MKIPGDPLAYAQKPPASLRGAVIYGPNRALVSEVVLAFKQSVLKGERDDFAMVTIANDELRRNPTILADEMSSFGFFASKKILYMRDPADGVVKAATDALSMPDAGHFLLIEADELPPKSALRQWAEKSDAIACLACYNLEGANLTRFIQAQFQKHNATIAGDALQTLLQRLGDDLSALPNLIIQLVDYVGGDRPAVKAEHVDAMLIDQAEHELDEAVTAIADSDAAKLDRVLHNMYEGKSMVAVLRSAQNYFYKLRSVQADMKAGADQDEALRKLRPPLFFKTKPIFIRHLRNWNLARIDRALSEFLYLESQCKKTGTPEIPLIQQRLLPLMQRNRA